jgi:hypothetical protein
MFDKMATSVTDSDPCKSWSSRRFFFLKREKGPRERENMIVTPLRNCGDSQRPILDDHVTIRPPYIFII